MDRSPGQSQQPVKPPTQQQVAQQPGASSHLNTANPLSAGSAASPLNIPRLNTGEHEAAAAHSHGINADERDSLDRFIGPGYPELNQSLRSDGKLSDRQPKQQQAAEPEASSHLTTPNPLLQNPSMAAGEFPQSGKELAPRTNRGLTADQHADIELYNRMTRAPASGPVKFGQKAVSPNFGKKGALNGASVQEVAESIRNGSRAVDDMRIEVIRWDGEWVAVNNRSLTALSMAGRRPTNVVDITESISLATSNPDNLFAVVQRLREMDYKPSNSTGVRSVNNDWNAPPEYQVEIQKPVSDHEN